VYATLDHNPCPVLRRLLEKTDTIVIQVDSVALSAVLNPGRDHQCLAQPKSPYINILHAIEVYSSCGVPVDQLMLQISWKGWVYGCDTYDAQVVTCISMCTRKEIMLIIIAQKKLQHIFLT